MEVSTVASLTAKLFSLVTRSCSTSSTAPPMSDGAIRVRSPGFSCVAISDMIISSTVRQSWFCTDTSSSDTSSNMKLVERSGKGVALRIRSDSPLLNASPSSSVEWSLIVAVREETCELEEVDSSVLVACLDCVKGDPDMVVVLGELLKLISPALRFRQTFHGGKNAATCMSEGLELVWGEGAHPVCSNRPGGRPAFSAGPVGRLGVLDAESCLSLLSSTTTCLAARRRGS